MAVNSSLCWCAGVLFLSYWLSVSNPSCSQYVSAPNLWDCAELPGFLLLLSSLVGCACIPTCKKRGNSVRLLSWLAPVWHQAVLGLELLFLRMQSYVHS